jgi:hypothetical protein
MRDPAQDVREAVRVDGSIRLEVFALRDGKWVIEATFKGADAITAPPFEAHTFALDVLWPDEG